MSGIFWIINLGLSFLPTYTGLPSDEITSWLWFYDKIGAIESFFPMGAIFEIFNLWLTIELAIGFFKFVMWIFGKSVTGVESTTDSMSTDKVLWGDNGGQKVRFSSSKRTSRIKRGR